MVAVVAGVDADAECVEVGFELVDAIGSEAEESVREAGLLVRAVVHAERGVEDRVLEVLVEEFQVDAFGLLVLAGAVEFNGLDKGVGRRVERGLDDAGRDAEEGAGVVGELHVDLDGGPAGGLGVGEGLARDGCGEGGGEGLGSERRMHGCGSP